MESDIIDFKNDTELSIQSSPVKIFVILLYCSMHMIDSEIVYKINI